MSKKIIGSLLGIIIVGAIACVIGYFMMQKEVTISHENLIMYTGYTKDIYLKNYDGVCEWKSLDTQVANVSDGCIEALRPGETVILCTTEEDEEYICKVQVYQPISYEYHKQAYKDVEWLESLQLDNGSFSCYELEENMPARVNPYFGSYAAIAILRYDHEAEKYGKIEHFVEWYLSHMNMKKDVYGSIGTIYDYTVSVKNGHVVKEESKQQYDSADSYVAMFLMLVEEYIEKYDNKDFIIKDKDKYDILVDLLLLLQKDNYTESKNGSNVKYLMNNMEAYQGLLSAKKLYDKLWSDDKRVSKLAEAIEGFEKNFIKSWASDSYYYPVLDGHNDSFYGDKMEWSMLYEYAVPQLFPVIFGIVDPDDELMKKVYEEFCSNWDWTKMEFENDGSSANQTWSLIAYAAMKMEDSARVDAYIEHYIANITDRSFPFYSGDAVWFVLTCEEAYNYYSRSERNGILHPQYKNRTK